MPLYMDLHILPGVKARDVAEAHRRDLLIQDDHRCQCMTYWIDEKRGNVFCLIEAPSQDAVEEMHGKAHGLIPHKIIEVNDTIVESFLGRISDPDDAPIESGLKVFADSSFRILLVVKWMDPLLMQHLHGKEKAIEMISQQLGLVRDQLKMFNGSEAENNGHTIIASFTSAGKAIECALSITGKIFGSNDKANHHIAIHAGEPVSGSERIFGETIQAALRMCAVSDEYPIVVSSAVGIAKDHFIESQHQIRQLTPHDENLLSLIFDALENNWENPEFTMDDYRLIVSMSTSQLYRKTVALTGISPNALLKDFRLEKAKELMKKKPLSIGQISFNTGFSSPSYFTKCFKKKYGLLPMTYLDLLEA